MDITATGVVVIGAVHATITEIMTVTQAATGAETVVAIVTAIAIMAEARIAVNVQAVVANGASQLKIRN